MKVPLRKTIAWLAICLGGTIGAIGRVRYIDRMPLSTMDTFLGPGALAIVLAGIWLLPKDRR